MRCPKCHYIGFDTGDRCRNCGYDFSLSAGLPSPPDLPIRSDDEPLGPLVDLSLNAGDAHEVESGGRAQAERHPSLAESVGIADADLPLFLGEHPRSGGVTTRPPAPRAPLAVRRPTPDFTRARTPDPSPRVSEPTLALEPPEIPVRPAARQDPSPTPDYGLVAPRVRRITAASIDVLLLGAIDAGVVLLTLRLCSLTMSEWTVLPVLPLLGYLALLDGGYLVAFTVAGGQTIGKMACGIKVIGADGDRVHLGVAVWRAAAYLVSVLPCGVGFLAGLVDRERRTLHDRLAETRVVKVS